MNSLTRITDDELSPVVESACAAIAPVWPLDRFIAVNPFWSHIERPLPEVAARLSTLSGARLVMDRRYFRNAWRHGEIRREHLDAASEASADELDAGTLIDWLEEKDDDPEPLPLLSELAGLYWEPAPGLGWPAWIRDQISRFCALYFDRQEADWKAGRDCGLYREWRAHLLKLRGDSGLTGHPALQGRAASLPDDAGQLIRMVLAELEVPAEDSEDYLTALLLSINGWASWCAWRRWQARLEQDDDSSLQELLAIRLAWEWLLDDGERDADSLHGRWQRHWRTRQERIAQAARRQAPGWVWQRALEEAWQQDHCRQLAGHRQEPASPPAVQAVFCIDVRSEVLRRALEQCDPAMETRGFAGFFGLPIAYRPLGTEALRPQLPGLLAPALEATDRGDNAEALEKRRGKRLAASARWKQFEYAPGSIFTLVESLGVFYAGKLIRRSLALGREPEPHHHGLTRREIDALRPSLATASATDGAELAARVLAAMGLTDNFANLVLLAGHGSQSANNPHAAGLDCGACCGQTGEVNARALAGLLNDPGVREALVDRGIRIPGETRFLAALHNTTTDEVTLFDTQQVPESLLPALGKLRKTLRRAGDLARAERAPSLGLAKLVKKPDALAKALGKRARDWGQVRPEWGLANNAAFIAAPRSRSRGLDFAGRAFLHDYDWQADTDFETLELILTAPLVVAHWINMQYYASTVDNARYGSGNKVLHNVVGGHLGVLEGNGDDLRIGLPWQSLHDGERLMHQPLRLSAFIEAPAAAIDDVLERQATVRNLVRNAWLHLFRLDSDSGQLERLGDNGWSPVSG